MAYVTQRELNDARNDRIFAAVTSAHNRFIGNRVGFMESNPNAVSNFERNAVLGRARQMEDEDRLRAHEMAMLQQQGINEADKEFENAQGLIGQQSEAARFKAGAERYKADAEKAVALKKFEMEAANGRAQFGFFDADGTYHGGSDVERTKAQAEATLENARLEREARIRAAELNGQWHRDVAQTTAAGKTEAAKTTAAATVEAAEKKAAQAEEAKIARVKLDLKKGQFVSLGYTASKLKKMTPEELTEAATKIAGFKAEEATPPATTQTATPPATGPKEGDRKKFSNGEAVFKDGKWVPVK